jgi:hypothetical protein
MPRINIKMVLGEGKKDRTILGWDSVRIIDFGYDAEGDIQTVVAIGEYVNQDGPTGSFGVFSIHEPDISEDLWMNYDVAPETLSSLETERSDGI